MTDLSEELQYQLLDECTIKIDDASKREESFRGPHCFIVATLTSKGGAYVSCMVMEAALDEHTYKPEALNFGFDDRGAVVSWRCGGDQTTEPETGADRVVAGFTQRILRLIAMQSILGYNGQRMASLDDARTQLYGIG